MAAAAAVAGHFVDIREWEYKKLSCRLRLTIVDIQILNPSSIIMQPFTKHTGLVVPMDRANVDTDQIIPKQFLKRIERTGFGQFLFFDWRFRDDGSDNPEFELNQPEYNGASVLLARRNFGCGSSREHAPWALEDYGFRVVIAPSFADIFYNNCFKNGMLPIRLDEAAVDDCSSALRQTSRLSTHRRLGIAPAHRRLRPVAAVRGRRVPPPLPAQRPGRHRPDARARRQNRCVRGQARNGRGLVVLPAERERKPICRTNSTKTR